MRVDQIAICPACLGEISLASAGQIVPAGSPPYFVVIDRSLPDEGTSYHYAPQSEFAEADAVLGEGCKGAGKKRAPGSRRGSWTTDLSTLRVPKAS
jgi:hypothetical protein